MKNYHLCKEDYEEVKSKLSMRKVAEYYGHKIDRNNSCKCPFHNDNRPSLKIYEKSYYCWSCGAGGDLINFVGRVYGLSNEGAALQIINDFSLPDPTRELSYREKREREQRNREYKKLNSFVREANIILNKYHTLLCRAFRNYADPNFDEACQELTIVEYRIESLKEYPEEYYKDKKAVEKIGEIERRIDNWNGYS